MSIDVSTLLLVFVFIFGTFIGSFLNVVIWRLPRDQKLTGRSQCPKCKHQLTWIDLIPVISFLINNAQCRYCGKQISWRYPLIELISGILFMSALLLVGPNFFTESSFTGSIGLQISDWLTVVRYSFVFLVLLAVFIIDLEHYLILDRIIFPAVVVVLVLDFIVSMTAGDSLVIYSNYLINILAGMLAGFLPFYLLWKFSKGRWMGLGDAKFGLFLGAVFGFPMVWLCYFIAFILGALVALPLLATGKKELSSKLPFGTFLAVSALITVWLGVPILGWYLQMIGLV